MTQQSEPVPSIRVLTNKQRVARPRSESSPLPMRVLGHIPLGTLQFQPLRGLTRPAGLIVLSLRLSLSVSGRSKL